MDNLSVLRDKIDRIDREMVALLDRRTELASKLALIKFKGGQKIEDFTREQQVLNTVKRLAKDPVVQEHIGGVYELLMRIAKIKQHQISVLLLPYEHVGIIGRGMMGGSIQKAISQANFRGEAVFVEKISEIPRGMELLILAIPTSEVLKLTPEIAEQCENLVVIDIASVKQPVADAFELFSNESVEFVATHPMAGSEKSGIEHASGELFFGRRWIITPHENNRPKTLERVEELIHCLQSQVIYMDAKSHDEKIGLVSHMARVLSFSLEDFVMKTDPMSLELAGPGFHSMTRLAKGNPNLLDEMVTYNTTNMTRHLENMIDHLMQVKNALDERSDSTGKLKERIS